MWDQSRGRGFSPLRLIGRLVVLAFAVIQLILVARILLDLGVIPADLPGVDLIGPWSEVLIAPVAGLASGVFGGGFGGALVPGGGFDPAVMGALVGWTIVEGLVLGVVRRFVSA
jgi:hypothetical protein